jgi:hypothetical protein
MAVFTRIGKYEVRRQLGRGAMGVVFEAFDPTIERRVAIKTLRLEVFESSQLADVRARFKREAQLAGRMSHPHIVTVHDYGEHEGTPYIVMEYMGGQELSAILQKGARLPLSEAVRLMTQLLGALAYAHEHKVVHRDIKPGNIFVLEDGSLKVVDFGIARMEASNLTDTGAMLGTPAYMSPEQFLAMPVDERSDIFSAGVIFYELLTGDKPFTGSVTTIMQKVLRQEPIEPSVLNPLIAAAWDVVVKRAMAKKPEARFSSARQFSETIKQVFDARSAHISIDTTLPATMGRRPVAEETLKPNLSQPVGKIDRAEPMPAKATRISKRGLGLTALLAAIVLGVTVSYSYLKNQEAKNAEEETKRASDAAEQTRARAAVEKASQDKAAAERAKAEKLAIESGVAAELKLRAEREAAAKARSEEDAKKLAEQKAKTLVAAARKDAEKAAERAAAEKAATEKAERVALEKTAAERAATEKAAAERAATEKAATERFGEQFAAAFSSQPRSACEVLGRKAGQRCWVFSFPASGAGTPPVWSDCTAALSEMRQCVSAGIPICGNALHYVQLTCDPTGPFIKAGNFLECREGVRTILTQCK